MPCDRSAGHRLACAAWGAGVLLAAAAVAPRAVGFRATPVPPTRLTACRSHGGGVGPEKGFPKRQHAIGASARAWRRRDRWVLRSGQAESLGKEEEGAVGSMTSDEANNWGMDDSIDVNAIRMKLMEKAGYTKREDSDAGEEWITVDEDGTDETMDRMKDAVAESLRNELLGQDSLNEADASALVEEVLQDTDLAKFFDEEFEKGTSALRELAEELKTDEGAVSYADRMAQELAELLQAEEDKAAAEIERRQAPVKAKLDKATAELEEAVAAAEEARREFEGDFVLQLMSFRQKGVLRQAAFVGAVLIANQAVYQAILVADDRGGNPAFALGGLAASAALVWYYGYRPPKR
ncbi:unnamed protein product [Ectocarpus sp. 4 AP-2014]